MARRESGEIRIRNDENAITVQNREGRLRVLGESLGVIRNCNLGLAVEVARLVEGVGRMHDYLEATRVVPTQSANAVPAGPSNWRPLVQQPAIVDVLDGLEEGGGEHPAEAGGPTEGEEQG